ncbi:YbdK family carboxylate-amine ligase [Pseudaquabacterium rugosum]|uniref:Putative glutamate--cysteine ligase 2 n=1 Tax=Pseudaquabacterium rugosum TaxID=2984194 RepID=A0ABU9B949_9BURK
MRFTPSAPLTFGLELELQVLDPRTGRLVPAASGLWTALQPRPQARHFALEATQATIEFNSSVHTHADRLADEVAACVGLLREVARDQGLELHGGGTQIAQFWNQRVLTPTPRARLLTERFGFLPKRFSTYGMHVHVGMPDGEQALAVANVLQALSPLFIAMSAASPFLQLADSGLAACRPLEPLVYPHGGPMPVLRDWAAFEAVVQDYVDTGIADTLKDIYWDVRPKPEFGTVEVRVFDTPLSVRKAVALAAFTRALAGLALRGQLVLPDAVQTGTPARRVSRFNACRHGMEASLHNPWADAWQPARHWLATLIDAVRACPAEAADQAWIDTLIAGDAPEDHAWMRAQWSALGGRFDGAEPPVALLADNARRMAARLLD